MNFKLLQKTMPNSNESLEQDRLIFKSDRNRYTPQSLANLNVNNSNSFVDRTKEKTVKLLKDGFFKLDFDLEDNATGASRNALKKKECWMLKQLFNWRRQNERLQMETI